MRGVDLDLLPTLGQLHRATLAAVVVAGVLGVTTVLPAEWAVDPTGVGSVLGLTQMGVLKQGAPVEGVDEAVFEQRSGRISVTLQAGQGKEVKAVMREGDSLTYSWDAGGAEVFYDFHGEPKGAAPDVFTSFEKDTRSSRADTFVAPFEGVHGWYWKNRGSEPVTVVLEASGVFHSLGPRP